MLIRLINIVLALFSLPSLTGEELSKMRSVIMDLFLGAVSYETKQLKEIMNKEKDKTIQVEDILAVSPEVKQEANEKIRKLQEELKRQKTVVEEALEVINLSEY